MYYEALDFVREKSRKQGIDAALQYQTPLGEVVTLDALIMSDRKGVGQQMAAQAGEHTPPTKINANIC